MNLLKIFSWKVGRQNNTYEKFVCFAFQHLDCYLIKFKEKSFVDSHKDVVPGYRHFRLNIYLELPKSGGQFICKNTILNNQYFTLFRPDINEHQLTKIEQGNLKILSFGVAIK